VCCGLKKKYAFEQSLLFRTAIGYIEKPKAYFLNIHIKKIKKYDLGLVYTWRTFTRRKLNHNRGGGGEARNEGKKAAAYPNCTYFKNGLEIFLLKFCLMIHKNTLLSHIYFHHKQNP